MVQQRTFEDLGEAVARRSRERVAPTGPTTPDSGQRAMRRLEGTLSDLLTQAERSGAVTLDAVKVRELHDLARWAVDKLQ